MIFTRIGRIVALSALAVATHGEMRETVERMFMTRMSGTDLSPESSGFIFKSDNQGPSSYIKLGAHAVNEHLDKSPLYKQPKVFSAPIPLASAPLLADVVHIKQAHPLDSYGAGKTHEAIVPADKARGDDHHGLGEIKYDDYKFEDFDYEKEFDDGYKAAFGDHAGSKSVGGQGAGGHDGGQDGGYKGANIGGHYGGHDAGQKGGNDGGHKVGHNGGHYGGFVEGQKAVHNGGYNGAHDGGHYGGHDGGHKGGNDGGHQGGHNGGHNAGHAGVHSGGYGGGHGSSQGGGHASAYGNGGSYGAEHHSEHGEKGNKGYGSKQHFSKGEAGHKGAEHHEGFYGNGAGDSKHGHEEASGFGGHYSGGKGYKGGDFGDKKGHDKGEKVDGYHKVYQKAEYKKDHQFYDDSDNSGKKHKYDAGGDHHGFSKGGHEKKGSHDSGYSGHDFGKKGYSDNNHYGGGDQGQASKGAGESYHHSYADHGQKGGEAGGKDYGFSVKH